MTAGLLQSHQVTTKMKCHNLSPCPSRDSSKFSDGVPFSLGELSHIHDSMPCLGFQRFLFVKL
jgi:hypothetical protein